MRKAVVVSWWGIIPAGTDENHENPRTPLPVRTAGLRAEIWTWDLPNTNQECYPLKHRLVPFLKLGHFKHQRPGQAIAFSEKHDHNSNT
jgi:hypothetical protein